MLKAIEKDVLEKHRAHQNMQKKPSFTSTICSEMPGSSDAKTNTSLEVVESTTAQATERRGPGAPDAAVLVADPLAAPEAAQAIAGG